MVLLGPISEFVSRFLNLFKKYGAPSSSRPSQSSPRASQTSSRSPQTLPKLPKALPELRQSLPELTQTSTGLPVSPELSHDVFVDFFRDVPRGFILFETTSGG